MQSRVEPLIKKKIKMDCMAFWFEDSDRVLEDRDRDILIL